MLRFTRLTSGNDRLFLQVTKRTGTCHGIVMSFDTDFFSRSAYSGEPQSTTSTPPSSSTRRDEARAFLRATSEKALLAAQSAGDGRAAQASAGAGAAAGAGAGTVDADATAAVKSPAPGGGTQSPVAVTLSTRASEPGTHWRQAICLLQSPFEFEAGTIVRGRLRVVRDAINHREQRIRVAVSEPVAFTQDFYLSS